MEAMGLENKDFSDVKINVSACTLESSSHIFSSYNVRIYSYFSKNDQQI